MKALHLLILLSSFLSPLCANEPAFIPLPKSIQSNSGFYTISPNTHLITPSALKETATIASRELGLRPQLKDNESHPNQNILLSLDTKLPKEGYQLDITNEGIKITGGSSTGVYYGIQSLRQTLPPGPITAPHRLNAFSISDQPRFSWRGLMIDCSRTFQSIDYLKNTIDRLAFYKMNVLHLHLTDDQGWRIEIKKYPQLTQKGARFSEKYKEPAANEGFYTQEELKDLVKYATARGVTLVPEIEMPGHSLEVLVCYPHLSCTGQIADDIFPFYKGPCVTKDILCAGNEDTFLFLENVLNEVMAIFPSPYIHVGADETPKDRWKSCAKCQQKMKSENLTNEHQLQAYFIKRIEKHLTKNNRRLIGWSEALEGGLDPSTTIMDWLGHAHKATNQGHQVIQSPTSHCYFDSKHEKISTQKAYLYNPLSNIPKDKQSLVIGLQACFWSHIDREPHLVDHQLYPRLLSIAERGWSQENVTHWDQFNIRLSSHVSFWKHMGIHYKQTP